MRFPVSFYGLGVMASKRKSNNSAVNTRAIRNSYVYMKGIDSSAISLKMRVVLLPGICSKESKLQYYSKMRPKNQFVSFLQLSIHIYVCVNYSP